MVEIMGTGKPGDCTRLGLGFIDIRGIIAKGSVVKETVESLALSGGDKELLRGG